MKTLKRRRKEYKTDYLKRLKLLKSGKPRLVYRKTNKYIIAQYVKSEEAKDKIEFGCSSKELMKYGWPEKLKGSLKSIPASYLSGYLIGKQIKKRKLEEPILDFGMSRVLSKSRVFAFIKGVIDSGINISCPEESFPEEERIKGKSLKKDISGTFDEIKLNIDKS